MSENTKTNSNQDYLYEFSNWEDQTLDLKLKLLRGIYAYGFEKPSAIQKKAIYPLIKNPPNDLIAQAQSGTGKTGTFTIGALQKVDASKNITQIIILAPTHELAQQSKAVLDDLGRYLQVKTKLLIGGTSVDSDKEALTKQIPHIIVGTPGRIHDMIRRKYINTDKLEMLIVDEADEMLSHGFKSQMYKIFQYIPENIQVSLFSATMPAELEDLAKTFMRNPIKILVKKEQLTLQGISQYFINIQNDLQKYETLKDLFGAISMSQAIIYCNSVKRVDDLEEAMSEDSFAVKKIHGKMPEGERKEIFKQFKNGGARVLITSDLFARGIDVQQVNIVINFDIPKSEHTYLHRIGRSGRWGRKGIAINFQSKHDISKLKRIEEYYSTQIEEMPATWNAELGN